MSTSSSLHAMWWVLPAALLGCLQDYDQFDFGAGGAGTTSAGGAGPATTGATMATGTTGTMSTTTTGSSTTTTTATTTTTTTTTATTTATTTSGMGGMGPVSVDCYGDTCDVTGGELCCAETSSMGICETNACDSGADIPITCDEQSDCPGEVCCVLKSGGNTNSVECVSSCTGSNADPLCSGNDPCQFGSCVPNGDLPGGYMNCD